MKGKDKQFEEFLLQVRMNIEADRPGFPSEVKQWFDLTEADREEILHRIKDKYGETQANGARFVFSLGGQIYSVSLKNGKEIARPPFNGEYLLYFLLPREERDFQIGDLIEDYGRVLERFSKRRADFWYYKQVFGFVFSSLRRMLVRIGAFVWLGRILRQLIS
jgi:hypothetical protein